MSDSELCAVVVTYIVHKHNMSRRLDAMRRPSSARRDCQSKTRRRRRVARSACQRLGAQRLRRSRTLRRQWRLGRGVHGAHSHLPHFLAPPAQSREGGRRQGERWDACKRRTFFFTSGAGHAYHVGAGSAGQATSMRELTSVVAFQLGAGVVGARRDSGRGAAAVQGCVHGAPAQRDLA